MYISEEPLIFGKGLRIEFNEEEPIELYKYYSCSANNFKAIANCHFYCSHPYQFNDLTDSTSLSYDFSSLTFENYRVLFQDLVTVEKLLSMYELDKKTNFNDYRNMFYSLITQKLGIVSLTTNEMSNLMWGHYSDDTGYKVKFDKQKLIQSINENLGDDCMFFPINYINNKLHIDTGKYGNTLPLLIDISTKMKDWRYENEWRIVISKNDMSVPRSIVSLHEDHLGKDDRYLKYNSNAIVEIVLGFHFFNGKNFTNRVPKSTDEYFIDAKNQDLTDFLLFICEKLNCNISKAGLLVDEEDKTYNGTKPLKRSIEKLSIKHISGNTFSIQRNNRESVMKFE